MVLISVAGLDAVRKRLAAVQLEECGSVVERVAAEHAVMVEMVIEVEKLVDALGLEVHELKADLDGLSEELERVRKPVDE